MFGGKSDPFVRISRRTETTTGTEWQPVLQTAVQKNVSNPTWRGVQMPLARVCMGDMESKLRVEVRTCGACARHAPHTALAACKPSSRQLPSIRRCCMQRHGNACNRHLQIQGSAAPMQLIDWDASGSHDLIGSAQVSVNAMASLAKTGTRVGLSYKRTAAGTAGEVSFANARMTELMSFMDHLRAGLVIDFSVAIDFTLSNRDPSDRKSLHYRGAGDTPYEAAIKGVASVLSFYNATQCAPRTASVPFHIRLALAHNSVRKSTRTWCSSDNDSK